MKTLVSLNKNWIFWLDRFGIYSLPVGGIACITLPLTQTVPLYVCVLVVVGVSASSAIAHQYCLYKLVKCPVCQWNMAKFKSGENIPPKYLYNAFRSGKPCLNCGWKPGEKV